jgi:hypothetical protein
MSADLIGTCYGYARYILVEHIFDAFLSHVVSQLVSKLYKALPELFLIMLKSHPPHVSIASIITL